MHKKNTQEKHTHTHNDEGRWNIRLTVELRMVREKNGLEFRSGNQIAEFLTSEQLTEYNWITHKM